MSGFEIAGIVLGAFPLAIEGLKMYETLTIQWDIWRQTRREYSKCLLELNYQRLSFENNLWRLLLPVGVEPQMIETLIASPKGQEWRDIELDQALRHRLDKSYNTYLDIMHSLQLLMVAAEHHLGINSSDLQARLSASESQLASDHRSILSKGYVKYQQYRVKFSMGKSTREKFFSQLQTYNERLEKLLTSSDQLRELEKAIPQVFSSDTLLLVDPVICRFWQHAQKVYDAFSEAWTCNCPSHHVQLLLQNRKKDDREMRLILASTSTDVRNQHSGHSVILGGPASLGDPQQAPEENDLLSPMPMQPRHRPTRTLRSSLSRNKSHEQSQKGKRKASGPSNLSFEMQTLPSSAMRNAAPDCRRITNICDQLAEGFRSGTISGYLQGDTCRYYMSSRPGSTNRLLPQQKSLEDMLLNAENRLTRRQRYAISLILAASFLQLQDTRWVTSLWQKSIIMFPEQKSDTGGARLDAPFVAHNLREGDTSDIESNLPAQGLSSLGVTLLELCFGDVIENHPNRCKLPPGVVECPEIKTALDAQAAAFWLGDVTEEAGPDFMDAIGWCLSKHLTLHDESGWRQEMLKQVVWPLCKITSTLS